MKYERLGRRNLHYNIRHRDYAIDTTMMDIDSVEYDAITHEPLALVETKFGYVSEIDLGDAEFNVMCFLARDEIPVICLVYWPMDGYGQLVGAEHPHESIVHYQYFACGVNKPGLALFPKPTKLTEEDWVKTIYKIHQKPWQPNQSLSSVWVPVKLPLIMFR